jgi:hypothetical protein
MASLNFKASAIQFEERAPKTYDPLPAGDYEMMITASSTKQVKAPKTGSYLELEMQVISGEHSGRRHWERLNLDNPSQQTVKIAQEQLARLCMALRLDNVEDSVELHDTPFVAEVGIDKKDPTRNVIWNYRAAVDAPAAKPAAPAKPAPAAAPAKSARPWG